MSSTQLPIEKLGLSTRIAYGIGDFGPSMSLNVLIIFFFFFLTTAAEVPPNIAGTILLFSKGCNAVATLIVGPLSDHTHSRWGRRHSWMLGSAPIMAISFALHWWVPPLTGWQLYGYYLIVAIFFQVSFACFLIPYSALLTDISEDNQEHIRLNSWRFGFAMSASTFSLLFMEGLTLWSDQPQQQLPILGIVCAIATLSSIGWCSWQTEERELKAATSRINLEDLKQLARNRPFWLLLGIYACSWMALLVAPTILPYFVVNNLRLPESAITLITLIMKIATFGALFLWKPISTQLGKKATFWLGISIWIIGNCGLFYLHPEQSEWIYLIAALQGIGMAAAYLIPPSMVPEAIDWDELQTGKRREGIFNSIMLFANKMAQALGLFLFGQILSWAGFQESLPPMEQPESALVTIAVTVIGLPTIPLLASLLFTFLYPIDYQTHQETVFQLKQKRALPKS
ncbi:MAG: MFS transporter [Halothece sp.]